jgi:hypothetical protein
MANLTITRGTTLPNSSAKSDFHNLIDTATGSVSSIVNADIDSAAAIANSKLNLASIAQDVTFAGTTTLSSKILKLAKGADVASVAGAITLGDDGNYFDITGTNAITSITAKTAGTEVTLQFDSTASLVDGSNLKLAGNFTGAAEAQITLVSDGTNWFEVSRNNSSYTPTASNALTGSIVKMVTTETASVVTCATTGTTLDDTIPAITDGVQILSRTITPTNASNILLFSISGFGFCNSGANATVHLHKDGAAAIASTALVYGNNTGNFKLEHSEAAGGTSAQTWTVRLNPSNAGNTIYVNASDGSGTRAFGGVASTKITILEIKA